LIWQPLIYIQPSLSSNVLHHMPLVVHQQVDTFQILFISLSLRPAPHPVPSPRALPNLQVLTHQHFYEHEHRSQLPSRLHQHHLVVDTHTSLQLGNEQTPPQGAERQRGWCSPARPRIALADRNSPPESATRWLVLLRIERNHCYCHCTRR